MHKQPTTIEAIVAALEKAIAEIGDIGTKKEAAEHIAYDILYGNNAVDVHDFFGEYPELETIAELALEFDLETDETYLSECWNRIVSHVKIVRERLSKAKK